MATQVEIKFSGMSDSNIDCCSSRYVTTLALLDTETIQCM